MHLEDFPIIFTFAILWFFVCCNLPGVCDELYYYCCIKLTTTVTTKM